MVNERKIVISEGSIAIGSDGESCGRVAMVGAKYLVIVEGLFGQHERYLPIDLVAWADAEYIHLSHTRANALALALDELPTDELIFGIANPIPAAEREAVGLPVPPRRDFGLGDAPSPQSAHTDADGFDRERG